MMEVLTIRQTAERAKAEGLPATEYLLRKAVKTGQLPVCRVGQKQLVCWSNVLVLLTGSVSTTAEKQ